MATLHHGDCLEVLRAMDTNSVDSIVTDPPYGLSFMGKRWDYDVPSEEIWRECLRVLKPGGHLLAFAGTRTQHRMAVRIEDAGFEIRDMIAWVYGSGFPKSLCVSKAIDKAAGAKREVIGHNLCSKGIKPGQNNYGGNSAPYEAGHDITFPATDAAKQWDGWGTALKPALEPITMARKPLAGTVAANVLEYGTGGINVDGCRVAGAGPSGLKPYTRSTTPEVYALGMAKAGRKVTYTDNPQGRWPANLIHDGSDEINFVFSGGASDTSTLPDLNRQVSVGGRSNSPARFFYCAKASKADRDEGCERIAKKQNANWPQNLDGNDQRGAAPRSNNHPTVKPTALMRYLCRLVTPPGGTVLDPFMGSGSTGKAAVLEGFNFIGIEREAEYMKIAKVRIDAAFVQQDLFAA
jgi:DNA modification methylase